MFFLGVASNYSNRATFRHLFAFGTRHDSKRLKTSLATHYRVLSDHVALTTSGRAALAIALKSVVPKNSKVLINGFTCYAVLEALKSAGCIPIYADIEKSDLNFSVDTFKKSLKQYPDIKAIIIQNTLGNTIDIAPYEKIAQSHSIHIIEDLAHCAGAHYPDGREVGTVGDAAALSFGKGKSIDVVTGGAVIINNPLLPKIKAPQSRQKLSSSLRARWYPFLAMLARASFKIHCEKLVLGVFFKLHWIERSADLKLDLSTRLTHWQAKLALSQVANLGKNRERPLRDFALVVDRDKTLHELQQNGFHFSDVWYEVPVAPARYYQKVHFPESDCPNSVMVAKTIINIPTWYNKKDLKLAEKIIKENQL